jgi:hypothetical protein
MLALTNRDVNPSRTIPGNLMYFSQSIQAQRAVQKGLSRPNGVALTAIIWYALAEPFRGFIIARWLA